MYAGIIPPFSIILSVAFTKVFIAVKNMMVTFLPGSSLLGLKTSSIVLT